MRTPVWLWVVTLALLGVLIAMQRPPKPDTKREAEDAAGMGEIAPPKGSEFVLMGKFVLAMKELTPPGGGGGMAGPTPADQLVHMSDSFAGWEGTSRMVPASATNPPKPVKPGKFASPAEDRLRATIIAGEVMPPDELLWRVRDIEKTLDPKSELNEDVRTVRTLYGLDAFERASKEVGTALTDPEMENKSTVVDIKGALPAASHAGELSAAQKDGFKKRHGWFAELALSHGDANTPMRTAAVGQAWAVIVVLVLVGAGVLTAALTGLVLLIVWLVKNSKGEWRWRLLEHGEEPAPSVGAPATVWLETVAVFFAAFLGVKLLTLGLHAAKVSDQALETVALMAQWAILLAIFWPLARGVSWENWKLGLGWRAPRGIAREVGAGFLGYIAGLPVYFGMAIVVVVITLIISLFSDDAPKPAGNRITDMLEGGTWWQLVVIYLLATVWAPVVEETIFRGCLFKHLRRRAGVVLAGVASAAVFAVLHGYVIQGLFMVGTLGFWFALLREWRGSIIASATAHAIHNGVVMAVMLIVLSIASA